MALLRNTVSKIRNPKPGTGNPKPETRNPKLQHDIQDVVLLHGWGTQAGIWRDLAAQLAPRFRAHAPDLPGYGAGAACEPFRLEGIADAVARAAPRRCHVVGWSLGGQVALAWARRAPHQVVRLALIATTPCFVHRSDWTCAITAEVLHEFARALASDCAGTLRRFAVFQAQGDARARQVVSALRRYLPDGSTPVSALSGGLEVLRDTDLRGDLGSIPHSALVLHGDRDALAPLPAGEYMSRRLLNARLLVLRGAAHAPFLSKPEETSAALREFFDE